MEAPVIGSIIGTDADEFSFLVENFTNKLEFSAVEIPLSCPHTPGFGTLAGHSTPEMTYEITKSVRKVTNKPIIIKLSPNVPNICELAKAAEEAGASAINAINTLGPGMIIDIDTCEPVLDFMVGGLSGPSIKPVAIRCVYDIYKSVKIPIIGTGGITTGKDAIEMMLAGATAIGLGSAIYYRGIDVFKKINDEMKCFMERNNYKDISELVGKAHK